MDIDDEKLLVTHSNLGQIYHDAENAVLYRIEKNECPEVIYDFFIDALGREMEAIYSSNSFEIGIDSKNQLLLPCLQMLLQEDQRVTKPHKENVVSVPYSLQKLGGALFDVREKGYHRPQKEDMSWGLLYQELGLIITGNALHHTAAARSYRDPNLEMNLTVYSLQNAFPFLRVTNALYWSNVDGTVYKGQPDPRLALMYEFARRRALLHTSTELFLKEPRLNLSIVETTRMPPWYELPLRFWQRWMLQWVGINVKGRSLYTTQKKK